MLDTSTTTQLSADTARAVRTILANGWFRKGTTLGEGGWPSLAKQGIYNWKTYTLIFDGFEDTITARNDEIAVAAFFQLYDLATLESYKIAEVTTTYRPIVLK